MRTQLDERLQGSRRSRFLLELFGNSLHFPLANIFLELILDSGRAYDVLGDTVNTAKRPVISPKPERSSFPRESARSLTRNSIVPLG